LQDEAVEKINKRRDSIRERELMEKRKVVPGWLMGSRRC
jgi:hypothetical protein